MEAKPTEAAKEIRGRTQWHPVIFGGLLVGAVLFWPLLIVGLCALASSSEKIRLQGLAVMAAGLLGFLWGWKLLWPLFT